MAANRRKTLPPVSPKIATELRPLVTAIKEIMEVGEGVRGDPLDRKLTLRDLLDSGIGKLKKGQNGANPGSLEPGTGAPDLTIPPIPQGFEAVGAFDGEIFLTWDPPTRQYNNHAFTNIYRAEEDNFANATLVGQEPGMFFVDNVRADAAPKPYYYWISFTSTSNIEGPTNDTAGTLAQAASSPDYIIEQIEGLISESELADELLTPIQSIPGIHTTLTDHDSRINTIQTAVNEVLNLPEFDSATSYAEGDNVKYNGYAWRALQAMTAPSPTPVEGANWTQIGAYQTYDQLLSANAVAIDDLDIRITTAEGTLTSYGTDITALQNSVTDAQNDISGNSLAINTLDGRVTSTEGDISANSSDITLLQNGLTTAEGEITANSDALSLLDSRVVSAEGTITAHGNDITQLQADVQALDVDGNAQALQDLDVRVTANESDITAISSDVTTLSASVGDNTSALQTKAEVSAVQSIEDDITVLSAQYTIKLDVDGRVSGIGFSNDNTGSEMIVASDAVYFIDLGQSVTPFNPGTNYASMADARDTQLVFGYAEVEGFKRFVINVPAYIPELYVETGMFKDQVVTRAKIADLAVNGAKIDVADVWELNINDRIESDNYSPGNSGFQITRSGLAEFSDMTVRGRVIMQTGYIADSVQIGGEYSYQQGVVLFEATSEDDIQWYLAGGTENDEGDVISEGWYFPSETDYPGEADSFFLQNVPTEPGQAHITEYRYEFPVESAVNENITFRCVGQNPSTALEISVNGGAFSGISSDHVTEGSTGLFGTNYYVDIPSSFSNNSTNEVHIRIKPSSEIGDSGCIISDNKAGYSVNLTEGSGTPLNLTEIRDNAALADSWKRPGFTLIDGNKIFTGDAYVDTLQIKGNAVTVPVGALRTSRQSIPSGNFGTWYTYLSFTYNWDPSNVFPGQSIPCYLRAVFGTDEGDNANSVRLLVDGVNVPPLQVSDGVFSSILYSEVERLLDLDSGDHTIQVQISSVTSGASAHTDYAQVIMIGAKR